MKILDLNSNIWYTFFVKGSVFTEKKVLLSNFIPHPENHVRKNMDEWFSGGIPLCWNPEKKETTAVKLWSFILRVKSLLTKKIIKATVNTVAFCLMVFCKVSFRLTIF